MRRRMVWRATSVEVCPAECPHTYAQIDQNGSEKKVAENLMGCYHYCCDLDPFGGCSTPCSEKPKCWTWHFCSVLCFGDVSEMPGWKLKDAADTQGEREDFEWARGQNLAEIEISRINPFLRGVPCWKSNFQSQKVKKCLPGLAYAFFIHILASRVSFGQPKVFWR
jgi:hypothetical protein